MSTQMNHYIICGAQYSYQEWEEIADFEKCEPYTDSAFDVIKHRNGLCVISDGMNGEYAFVGRVLAKSANQEGFEEPVEIIADADLVSDVREALQIEFGASPEKIGIYAFTHYS